MIRIWLASASASSAKTSVRASGSFALITVPLPASASRRSRAVSSADWASATTSTLTLAASTAEMTRSSGVSEVSRPSESTRTLREPSRPLAVTAARTPSYSRVWLVSVRPSMTAPDAVTVEGRRLGDLTSPAKVTMPDLEVGGRRRRGSLRGLLRLRRTGRPPCSR